MKSGGKAVVVALAVVFCLGAAVARGDEKPKRDTVQIETTDGIGDVLQRYMGKRVTVRLSSGTEVNGTVLKVTGKLVVLAELYVANQSKSYYDSVIALGSISSIDIQVRE